MYRALIALLTCGLASAAESFESCATGAVSKLQTEYGALTAEPGHAEVLGKLARTGNKTLHIMGGKNRVVQLGFEQPLEKEATLSFWMERWTKANPFDFRLVADTPQQSCFVSYKKSQIFKIRLMCSRKKLPGAGV